MIMLTRFSKRIYNPSSYTGFMMPQRYHRTSDQDREIVECYENYEDLVTLAHSLGVRRPIRSFD